MAKDDAQPGVKGGQVAEEPQENKRKVNFRTKHDQPINHCAAVHDHLLDIFSELVGIKESWGLVVAGFRAVQNIDNDLREAAVHDHIKDIYGKLVDIRKSWERAVAGFRAVQNFDNDLRKVAVWSMPESVSFDQLGEENTLCDPALTDEGYAAELGAACNARTSLASLNLLWQLVARYQQGKTDTKRKLKKLAERVKLQRWQSPEWKIAVRKRGEMQSALDVIQHRIDALAGRYFETRRKLLEQVVTLDERFFELYKHDTGLTDYATGYEEKFVEAMLSNGARPMAQEIIRAEEAVRVANFNRKVSNKARKGF